MSQITLYLDDATQALVDEAAKANGVSKSRWVADIIRTYAAHDWPQDCLALAGAVDVHAISHVTGGGLAANLALRPSTLNQPCLWSASAFDLLAPLQIKALICWWE